MKYKKYVEELDKLYNNNNSIIIENILSEITVNGQDILLSEKNNIIDKKLLSEIIIKNNSINDITLEPTEYYIVTNKPIVNEDNNIIFYTLFPCLTTLFIFLFIIYKKCKKCKKSEIKKEYDNDFGITINEYNDIV
jgi:hypothetical protein